MHSVQPVLIQHLVVMLLDKNKLGLSCNLSMNLKLGSVQVLYKHVYFAYKVKGGLKVKCLCKRS